MTDKELKKWLKRCGGRTYTLTRRLNVYKKIVRNVKMPKINVELEVPDEYCDKPDNICPMCVDDGVASYCVAFNYALEEEDFHCKRLKACKKAEVKE